MCMYVSVCACACVYVCKKVCAFGHAVKQREKVKTKNRDLVVCLSNKSPNVLYIIAELRFSDGGLVAGTSSVQGTGMLFVLHRVYYNLLCTTACLCKTRTFSYQNDNFSRED